MTGPEHRPVWADVDLWAVRPNVRALAQLAAPAGLMAVVKADAYGHGAVPVARAALEAGATYLGVALVEEGRELREAGIDAPMLLMSEPPPSAAAATVALRLTPVVYTIAGVEALAKAVVELDAPRPFPLHLKVDTGMHRVGATPAAALDLARAIDQFDEVALEGVCTHFAVADEIDDAFTDEQLATFATVLDELRRNGCNPKVVHAANTAATIARPESRFDLVRTGIGIYGIAPAAHLADAVPLVPALSLSARVSYVKECRAGDRVSYGQRYVCATDTRIATVPIGYADGVPRALAAAGGEVLIGGVRRPIAGTITMDQLMVDCGDAPVMVGDEVVLLGRQGDATITATEWAERLGTIPYEVVCGIGRRVPRHMRG